MRKRIFIAINLPEEIKKKLSDYQSKWPELPCRWTKKENLHLTLFFLGYLTDEEVGEVCKITREVASKYSPFSISLDKILYGPPKKMPARTRHNFEDVGGSVAGGPPRMIWVQGEKSKELANLKGDLEDSLTENIRFSPESREFSPHLTLGRIKTWQWRQIEPEDRPEVEEDISLSFNVNSIEVMESKLKRSGPEYTILESVGLTQ